ncbi:hypothetical protein B0H19DRAFT_1259849 [Mycena capillaripes]|nr:hypothetical protein B0H19DRAFT_1259849 [Mycena capillaripes]
MMQQQAAAQAERDKRMMEMLLASRVPPPELAPVVPSRYTPPTRTPSPARRRGDYVVPVSETRSSVPSEEPANIAGPRIYLLHHGGCRCCPQAQDRSRSALIGVQRLQKAEIGNLPVCGPASRKHRRRKKSKPAAVKKKSAIISSDSEVEEIAPVVVPRTRIDRAAERLSDAERRLADVEHENRDLRRLVRELRDEVHRTSEGSSRLAQFVTGLIGFQSGAEEEMLWMEDARAESRRIAEDFRRREGGQGGSGLTVEEKEEADKKKKRAEVDALADTDGGSEKSDDAEDSPKVKEEKMDEGESWGEDFRRARGRTPPADTEVIVITDSEIEDDLREICAKRPAKGKGRAKRRVESDDEEVDSLKNSEDEENADPDADVEEDVAGKQMSEPPIVTEDVPKSDD